MTDPRLILCGFAALISLVVAVQFFAALRRIIWHSPPAGGRGRTVRLSVIIPARNEEQDLAQALQSVLQQAEVELEVILVNDHSSLSVPPRQSPAVSSGRHSGHCLHGASSLPVFVPRHGRVAGPNRCGTRDAVKPVIRRKSERRPSGPAALGGRAPQQPRAAVADHESVVTSTSELAASRSDRPECGRIPCCGPLFEGMICGLGNDGRPPHSRGQGHWPSSVHCGSWAESGIRVVHSVDFA